MNGKLRNHDAQFARVAASIVFCTVALSSAGCAKNIEKEAHAGPADARPQVTVAPVTQATVTEFSEHTGHTESPSTVEIRARATGYLTRAAFHEGDLVKKGELLFEVDPKPYQASLNRARAELASARVDVELARKNAARGEQLFQASVISEQDWDQRSATFHQLRSEEHTSELQS